MMTTLHKELGGVFIVEKGCRSTNSRASSEALFSCGRRIYAFCVNAMLPLDLPGITVTNTESDGPTFSIHAGCEGRPIAHKQAASHGGSGKRLGKGFCQALYARIAGLNLDAARQLASAVMAFAARHGATAVVVEDLKGWRPTGRGRQRKRFHRFQHRYLVKYLTYRCEERGLRLLSVYARGTSYYAYDGSGPVKRDKTNACLATFSNGRRYNADLNGAQNIAARGLAILLGLKPHKEVSGVVRKGSPGRTGKSSGRPTRIPLVLADIWAHARMSAGHSVTATGVSLDAPTTARSA